MTRYELLNLLVSGVGSVAVVLTVLYAAWQARTTREQAAVLSAQVVADKLLALDRVFIDYAELRPYFYDAQRLDVRDAITHARALAVAELTLDVFQLALTGGGRYSARHRTGIHAWIVRGFSRSPVLRAQLRADEALYSPALTRLLVEAEKVPMLPTRDVHEPQGERP